MSIDERTMMDKVSAGDFGAMDAGDIANVGQLASGPLVNTMVKSVPGGAAIGAGISGVSSYINSNKEAAILSQRFSKRNLRELKRQNPALRRKLNQMEERWQGDMVDAGFSMGMGAAAGFLIGLVIPLPFTSLIGSVIGGIVGHQIYTSALTEQAQDPVTMNVQVAKMAEEGKGVPVEAVFATLGANLSGKSGKMIGKLLKKYTGTELFTEALADPKNIPKLQAMMHNPVVDDAIRAQTGMPRDANNPMKTVAEQYAELINSGQMQAKNMLNTGEGLYILSAMQRGQQYNVDVPITPEIQRQQLGRQS